MKLKNTLFYRKYLRINVSRMVLLRLFLRCFGGLWFGGKATLAYLPGSIVNSKRIIFQSLVKKFVAGQTSNNAGDLLRLSLIIQNVQHVLGHCKVAGSIAEVGVYKGNTAAVLFDFARQYGRKIFLFDTFQGFDSKDLKNIDEHKNGDAFSDTSLAQVKRLLGEDEQNLASFVVGRFPDSVPASMSNESFSVVSLDCDLYEPMAQGLNWFYARMPDGAIFLIHDYDGEYWDGVKAAVDQFCRDFNQHLVIMPDKSGTAVIRISK